MIDLITNLGVATISLKEWFAFLISLFAITDPIGLTPIFLGMTAGYTAHNLRKLLSVSLFAMLVTLSIAIWFGEAILHFFGITIGDFQIAGGVILFLLGISMMQGEEESDTKSAVKKNIAVVPLAIPLIAGPGTFTTILVETHKYNSFVDKILINSNVLVIILIIGLILLFASKVKNLIGESGINVANKVMGMIVLAMSIEMLTQGLYKNFPTLQG